MSTTLMVVSIVVLFLIVAMFAGLQKANEPVKSIFDKVRTEVEDATSAQ